MIHAGAWEASAGEFGKNKLPDILELRRILKTAKEDSWAGFQLFYPMAEGEVQSATGLDLFESMLAIFDEVTPAMNLSMQIELCEKTID
jgi:hypothetical protein